MPDTTYNRAHAILDQVGLELFGPKGDWWPTMIGCGVEEGMGVSTVFVTFLKGTEPKEGFPDQVQGVPTKMRLVQHPAVLCAGGD